MAAVESMAAALDPTVADGTDDERKRARLDTAAARLARLVRERRTKEVRP